MAKKSPKPRDTNSMAARIVAQATDPGDQGDDERAPAAIARGKLGGTARAEKLSPHERSRIAKAAATARWQE
jgi:hypothetical protein